MGEAQPKKVAILQTEYDELLASQARLEALEAGGVDNWDWYHDSLKNAGLLEEEDDD
jgi:hypothetical protein